MVVFNSLILRQLIQFMLDNHLYNLMLQLTEENKSLWRIKEAYSEDSDCEDCRDFWEKLEQDKEQHVAELRELIGRHVG